MKLTKAQQEFMEKEFTHGKNKLILMCVVKRRDVGKVKEYIKKIDSNSFLIIQDARNVYGLGF